MPEYIGSLENSYVHCLSAVVWKCLYAQFERCCLQMPSYVFDKVILMCIIPTNACSLDHWKVLSLGTMVAISVLVLKFLVIHILPTFCPTCGYILFVGYI
jgi:hypothetical protein